MADEATRQRLMAKVRKVMETQGPTSHLAEGQRFLDASPIDSSKTSTIQVYVFAAQAGDPGARPVDDVRRSWGRDDGKLHIIDPYAGVPGGGREHVFDVPAGATHLQVFYELTTN